MLRWTKGRTNTQLVLLLGGVAACASLGFLAGSRPTQAAFFCPLLDSTRMVVGEARVRIKDSTDQFYANAYHHDGDEISIPRDTIVGKLSSGATFDMSIAADMRDIIDSDCAVMLTQFGLGWDTADPLGCTGDSGGSVANWQVDTCNSPAVTADTFQGTRHVGFFGLGNATIKFDAEVRVKEDGTTRSDDSDGCFSVTSSSTCNASL